VVQVRAVLTQPNGNISDNGEKIIVKLIAETATYWILKTKNERGSELVSKATGG
jgi:hypothetical protein